MSKSKDNKQQYSEKNIKSMKVAIFCIAALVIFYFGCNFLKGLNVFNRKTHLYAVFENVGDLHESTNVVFNGFPIGKVNDITLLSTNPPRICAEILLTEDIDIPVDSRFEVAQKDVLGGMIVNLVMGGSKTFAKEKDTLGSMLAPGMFDGIDEIAPSIRLTPPTALSCSRRPSPTSRPRPDISTDCLPTTRVRWGMWCLSSNG